MRKRCGQDDLTLSSCLCPEKFDAVAEATKVLGGYSKENKEGEMVLSKLRHYLSFLDILLKSVQLSKMDLL